jgi:hypothetical protein
MDDQPIHDPIAQVVAWHNRHPLALRIKPEHVSGVGVVSLPFVAADEQSLKPWQRWPKMVWQKLLRLAKRPEQPAAGESLSAAFSEDFIAPISAKRVAAFALRHGSPERPGAADLPQREVAVDEKLASGSVVHLYLTTACVEKGKDRVRVLLGNAAKAKFIGGRLWDKPKRAAAAGVVVLLVAAPLAIGLMWGDGGGAGAGADGDKASGVASVASAAQATAVVPAASAASEPAKPESPEEASTNASAPSGATGVAEASDPAPEPDPPASATAEQADSAAAPASAAADRSAKLDAPTEVDAAPDKDAIELGAKQALRPGLSSEDRAEAVRQANLLRSQTPAPPAPVAKPTKVYALVTALTGTRAASERRLRMMGLSFAGGKMSGDLRSEIMKVDKGWRATLWPFTSRKEAEAARDMLAERGVYTEVLAF